MKKLTAFYKSDNFIARNLPVIVAFIIPVVSLFFIFMARGIYPFGENMYLRSDMYHQYAPFLREFQRILQGEGSLLYTWRIGLGSDFVSTYAYYLASPVNWLIVLFPAKHIPEVMSCFIIIKAGLMSSTFTYYVQKHFGKKTMTSAFFGVFYGMSSYMCAYSWNLMWLDCLVLLPLIVLGLERMIKENKVALYTITLGVAIFSNYYIAIMICIFLVFYFLYLIITEYHGRFSGYIKAFGRFALYSVLAGLMAAAVVIPAYLLLSSTASGNFSFPTTLKAYYNPLEMIAHAVMIVEPTVLSGYIPNVYSTVGLFILIPLYWINRDISYKEKIGKTILMMVFIFSFALNIPTYIWHGFHYPNSLSSRQSFIYIFLTLVMAYELMINLKKVKIKEIAFIFACAAAAVMALQVLYSSETYTVVTALVNVGFLALYTIWLVLFKLQKLKRATLLILIGVLCVTEACVNTSVTGYSTSNRTTYLSDNDDITEMLEAIDDDGFYRVEKEYRRTKNDGAWSGYRSASEFSSTTIGSISSFYKANGLQSLTNSFGYYGHTPLTSAILSVKYLLSKEKLDDQLLQLVDSNASEYLYEQKYALSLGFMTNIDVQAETNLEAGNPFDVQNSFVNAACDIDGLYNIERMAKSADVSYIQSQDGRTFVYVKQKAKSVRVVVTRNGREIYNELFSGLENAQILDIGDFRSGDVFNITSEDEDVKEITVYCAVMEYEKLEEVMGALGENELQISSFSETYISGTIHVDEEGMMFTSIPYSKGWEAYVDGEKVDIQPFYNAFITVRLTEGEHTIEFRYHSDGLGAAIGISITALLIFILLMIMRKMRNREKYTEKS